MHRLPATSIHKFSVSPLSRQENWTKETGSELDGETAVLEEQNALLKKNSFKNRKECSLQPHFSELLTRPKYLLGKTAEKRKRIDRMKEGEDLVIKRS